MENWITSIAVIIIAVLIAAVSKYMIPYIQQIQGSGQMEDLLRQVRVFVEAAEMLFADGKDKLKYVLDAMEAWLGEKDMTVGATQLRAMVESAVFTVNTETDKQEKKATEAVKAGAGTDTAKPAEPVTGATEPAFFEVE